MSLFRSRPEPIVTWWSDHVLLERESVVTLEGQIRSDLIIPKLGRAHHQRTFTCKAQNNNQQRPLSQDVTIEMNLRPQSVKIKPPAEPLTAGTTFYFSCESKGSRPPAIISWFQDGRQVDASRTQTRWSAGEVTTGVVTLVPSRSDDGRELRCEADNPEVPDSARADTLILQVHYPPVVVLEMGRSLKPHSIKQGDDVYFECRVTANPPPYRVTYWRNVSIYLQLQLSLHIP
ncbi:hypothetical protein Pmani_035406 [Petrolisthes manimaculis]|uniref:Ig-like domain-containing protein n=1 Tax=Petrolisthes manimaculis TaxID=1843537 RepID=A0AAE1TQH8_9EUCA|nr:hypothetical protein Pmani_035406 [Petrolisthes manimaculis]